MNSETGVVSRKPTRRLPLWDNARFLAVTLVIVGHAIQRLTYDSDAAFTFYVVIYAFHIPLFLLISGYFTKSDPPTVRSMARVFTDLIVPYFIFEIIWALVEWMVTGNFGFDPTRPAWTLWFLVSLATFKVILPYLAMLRWPFIISIVISVGGGYLTGVGSTFSLARTLGFLPFFVLGWKISQMNIVDGWLTLGRKIWWVRVAAVAFFATTIAVLYPLADVLREHKAIAWLYNKSSYESLGVDSVFAGGIRLGLIALAIVLCAAFLSLIPRRATVFTALGAATMYIYLLHTFVLYPLRESDILTNVTVAAPWIVGLIVASIALSFLLSSKPVLFLFRPLIQPKTPWLFSKTALAESSSLPRVAPEIDQVPRDS